MAKKNIAQITGIAEESSDTFTMNDAVKGMKGWKGGKYAMENNMDAVAKLSVAAADKIPQINGKGSPRIGVTDTYKPTPKQKKPSFISEMSTIDKVGMGMNALATVGSMVAATKGIIDTHSMKGPNDVGFTSVEAEQVEDRSGARKAAGDAEIDSAVAANLRMNESAGRLPDDGTLSVVKLDAQRKSAAQIEGEKQQVDGVNAQLKTQAKSTNAQLSLSANAQTVSNNMNFNAMRTQIKSQNVNTLTEAPMNLAGSIVSYNNAKGSIAHARNMESLNLLQAQLNSATDPITRIEINNQIKELLSKK